MREETVTVLIKKFFAFPKSEQIEIIDALKEFVSLPDSEKIDILNSFDEIIQQLSDEMRGRSWKDIEHAKENSGTQATTRQARTVSGTGTAENNPLNRGG